jgi:transcriptional regulator with XRE-family HTH domain
MSSLSNYLRTNRKRAALSQEEAAFLLGINGPNKAAKVCRDENFAREPNLQTALAYEAIYGKPVRELFAGQYQRIEQDVAARAKILAYRKDRQLNQKRHQTLAQLILRHVNSPLN